MVVRVVVVVALHRFLAFLLLFESFLGLEDAVEDALEDGAEDDDGEAADEELELGVHDVHLAGGGAAAEGREPGDGVRGEDVAGRVVAGEDAGLGDDGAELPHVEGLVWRLDVAGLGGGRLPDVGVDLVDVAAGDEELDDDVVGSGLEAGQALDPLDVVAVDAEVFLKRLLSVVEGEAGGVEVGDGEVGAVAADEVAEGENEAAVAGSRTGAVIGDSGVDGGAVDARARDVGGNCGVDGNRHEGGEDDEEEGCNEEGDLDHISLKKSTIDTAIHSVIMKDLPLNTSPMPVAYKEYRCNNCSKLLFKGLLVDSIVEVKCKRCSAIVEFKGESVNALLCLVPNCAGRVTTDSN